MLEQSSRGGRGGFSLLGTRSLRRLTSAIGAGALLSVSVFAGQAGATQSVRATIAVGKAPGCIAVNPSAHVAYVTNYGSGSVKGTISVLNETTNKVKATWSAGTNPAAVAYDTVNNLLYVANVDGHPTSTTQGYVSVLNATSGARVATIGGMMNPWGVAVNAKTNTVYVANSGGWLSVIKGSTNTVTKKILIPGAQYVAVDGATNTIYVVQGFGGSVVWVINGATNQLTTTITVGSNLGGVAVNPLTNTIYVAKGGRMPWR